MLIKILVITVLGFILQHVLRFIYLLGFHQHNNKHYPGPCQKVKGIDFGSENFHVFPDGLAFITSGFRIQHEDDIKIEFMKKHNITGKMFLFDFNNKEIKVQQLTIEENNGFTMKRFGPHGISGWDDKKTGKRYIFVVNHEIDGDECIEKFLYIPEMKELKHIHRYTDETMLLLNDIQATGENSFYFTNFGTGSSKTMMMIMILGQFAWTTVVYFDGNKYKVVLDKMAMSNGIAMSHNGRFVYVNCNIDRTVVVYERKDNNDLVLKQTYPVYTSPDNVIVDVKTDNLYIGAAPIMYTIINHVFDPAYTTPSQVLKLDVKDGMITDTTEIFYDDGNLISGSTTAIIYDSKLLIGSILNNLVYCDVKIPV